MRIVVTGGAGALGSRVVTELSHRSHDVVAASRRTGVDLATGEGLASSLAGAEAVVHCADDPARGRAVTVDGTRRLADAVAALPEPAHLVHVSVVGCDLVPFAYYRNKTAAEEVVQASGARATVLRATQFHSLAARVARRLGLGPVTFSIGEMAVQPVDTGWVASRLADLAAGQAPTAYTRATDVAGPDVFSLGELATLVRTHAGRGEPRVVRVPPVGALLRSLSDGTLVPRPGTAQTGGQPFRQWLHRQPRVLRGR